MKKLSKADVQQHGALVNNLQRAQTVVENAVETFNATMRKAWEDVVAAKDAYALTLQEAETFRAERYAEMEEYLNDRSDNWHGSDAGEQYSQWMNEWDGELEELELEEPEEADVPSFDTIDSFEQLPLSAEDA